MSFSFSHFSFKDRSEITNIRKTATGTDRRGPLPLQKQLLGHHEAFFTDVLLRRLVQLLLEKAEEVALAHVESVGDLTDVQGGA